MLLCMRTSTSMKTVNSSRYITRVFFSLLNGLLHAQCDMVSMHNTSITLGLERPTGRWAIGPWFPLRPLIWSFLFSHGVGWYDISGFCVCVCAKRFLRLLLLNWDGLVFFFLSHRQALLLFLSLGHIHRCSLKSVVYVREKWKRVRGPIRHVNRTHDRAWHEM